MDKRSLVSVVDDDQSVRESLPDLLREFGFAVQAFSSAEEFLASDCIDQTSCLILDITMPGMSGPDLARALQASLLPPNLPNPPGLECGGRYAAAGEGNGEDHDDMARAGRHRQRLQPHSLRMMDLGRDLRQS